MVEEGGNPILEGSIAMASNLQDMLLQDYAYVVPGATFLAVFPAVPTAWDDAVFHHFRTLGAFLVSAKREGGKTAWVQIVSDAGQAVVLTTDFGTGEIEVTSSPEGAKLVPLEGAANRWRIEGLGRGGVALLAPRGGAGAKASVAALPAEPGRVNYYGFRRDEW